MTINAKIAILVEDNYQEMELWYPYYRLKEAGAECDIVGVKKTVYKSKLGYPAQSNKTIEKVNADDYDAVIIPGGYAPDIMRRHRAMVDFVKSMYEKDKVVAAICHAAWMLSSADILKGKKATCYYAIQDDIKHAGAQYLDQSVVQDGKLITSRQPDDLPDFCRTIIETLSR